MSEHLHIDVHADNLAASREALIADTLQHWDEQVRLPALPVEGKLVQMTGLTLVAAGCQAAIGSRCHIVTTGHGEIEAEVVGFSDEKLFLMPIGRVQGLSPGARVIPQTHSPEIGVGPELLGRVIDSSGRPIDKLGEL